MKSFFTLPGIIITPKIDSGSIANRFHLKASPFLFELGFQLINDPNKIHRLGGCRALYKTELGFYLCVGFEPHDGRSVVIFCGRYWEGSKSYSFFSNSYHMLAEKFGNTLPSYYKIMGTPQDNSTLDNILMDLKQTLPFILNNIKLHHIIEIEESYAIPLAKKKYGPNYSQNIIISDFNY